MNRIVHTNHNNSYSSGKALAGMSYSSMVAPGRTDLIAHLTRSRQLDTLPLSEMITPLTVSAMVF